MLFITNGQLVARTNGREVSIGQINEARSVALAAAQTGSSAALAQATLQGLSVRDIARTWGLTR